MTYEGMRTVCEKTLQRLIDAGRAPNPPAAHGHWLHNRSRE